MAPNVSSPVLVTGVTGFVGAHVALELLSRGYKVRGTMRNVSKANSLRELPHFTKYIESGQLSFVEVPDVGKGDFTDAMKGVEWVMHIASPFSLSADNGLEEYVKPAVQGTENVIKAAHKAGTVKNFVVTSSFAAVLSMDDDLPNSGKIYTEDDWNRATYEEAEKQKGNAAFTYCASKKLAEKAAYDFAKNNNVSFKVASVCPPMVNGPFVHPVAKLEQLNESSNQVWSFVTGKSKGEIPPTGFPAFADVRNLAQAHVNAAEKNAEGRFLIYNGPYDNQKIADFVYEHFPAEAEKNKVPRGNPGEWYEKNPKLFKLDPSRSQKELGIKYNSFEQTFGDAIKQMYEEQAKGK